jgi:membrane fusion protein, heavy metal efflux system
MKKHNYFFTAIVSLIIISLFSCKGGKSASGAPEEEALPEDIVEMRADQVGLAGIQTGKIELKTISSSLKANGVVAVSPQNMVTVCMPVGGYVKSVTLLPGNAISKGQTLAVLESQDYIDMQQNYLDAKFKLEFAEADYKRHSDLYKDDVYSEQNVQSVTADYKSLKAQVKALEQKLLLIGINPSSVSEDNITRSVAVVSPINGYIKSVDVNAGKYVAPADVMFELVNSDKLYLELTLFENDADKVASGQKIHFFINNETEQHDAVIYQTGKAINDDKTYKVYATVESNCKNVIPGMYVNALIESSGTEVMSVPSEAIVNFDDKDYIFVFVREKEEGGKPFTEYRMIEVQKGITDGINTGITVPVDLNTQSAVVVVKGTYNLMSAKKNAGEMAC